MHTYKHFKTIVSLLIVAALFGVSPTVMGHDAVHASGERAVKAGDTYTITPDTLPINAKFLAYTTYNDNTKHYYLFRSMVEKFEAAGGGVLNVKAGTYVISNTIYIPSNVTINFEDGVYIKKTMTTGTSKFRAAKSMFQLCETKVASAARKYKPGKFKRGYRKHNGVHNVNLVGSGNVTIDSQRIKGSITIIMAHNKDINISGITFVNMNAAHFIEVDAGYKVNIQNCKFLNGKNKKKEAVNLDTPDRVTKGFNSSWSSFDKTANNNVTIQGCEFRNLPRALGTHNYSLKHPHRNIKILNNTIDTISSDAISAMYWKNSRISGNYIANVKGKKNKAILCPGTSNLTVTGNTFYKVGRVAQFYSWKDDYPKVINARVTKKNIRNFKNGGNKYIRVREKFIRINKGWSKKKKQPVWTKSKKIKIKVSKR